MKRFALSLLIALCAVLTSCALMIVDAAVHAGKAVDYIGSALKVFAFKVFAGPAPEPSHDLTAADRPLIVAGSFQRRLVQRSRPEVTPGWRMCTST